MSYTKVYIHYVWSTKNRKPVLIQPFRQRLFDHIKQNALLKEIYLDRINGYHDHVHCLVCLHPQQSLDKVAHLLKGESSFWFNKQKDMG
ncbi:MAG: IS200/IS605 family transposase, partial [Bacteroidota bacterium]|nr:IS200/IS605 family transposase [Bacteroidota bacterium]